MYVCVHAHKCLVPMKARRGNQIPWVCSHGQLGAIMWVLGIVLGLEHRSPARVASVLNS